MKKKTWMREAFFNYLQVTFLHIDPHVNHCLQCSGLHFVLVFHIHLAARFRDLFIFEIFLTCKFSHEN